MKRKIIKQGHSTLTITLPSKWAKRFDLDAGREIDVVDRDNGLFISAEKVGDTRKAEFDISEMDIPTIWKHFMAVYREGYNEVKVKFNPGMNLESPYKFFAIHKLDLKYKKHTEKRPIGEVLQGFASRFIGFEIIEHGKDYVIIKEMGELTSKELDNSMRRVFLLVQQMAEEICEAVTKGESEGLEHMHDVDINVDKFHDYCIRILNRIGSKDPRKSALIFSTLYLLELIGDEFKNISHHLLYDFKDQKYKNIQIVADRVKEQVDSFYDLYYNYSSDKINKISDIDSGVYFNINDIYKKSKEEEKEILHHLRMIGRYINALLELRIEMEF